MCSAYQRFHLCPAFFYTHLHLYSEQEVLHVNLAQPSATKCGDEQALSTSVSDSCEQRGAHRSVVVAHHVNIIDGVTLFPVREHEPHTLASVARHVAAKCAACVTECVVQMHMPQESYRASRGGVRRRVAEEGSACAARARVGHGKRTKLKAGFVFQDHDIAHVAARGAKA